MEAVYYHGVRNFEIVQTAIPEVGDDEVLVKVVACGICGTDQHISEGEFITKFPLIPGHEIVGVIEKLGNNVKSGPLKVGDRCAVDPSLTCQLCFYCRRGQPLLCENYEGLGVTMSGGFAGYAVARANKVFHIDNITDEEATLIEPAACAVHGADKLALPVGADVLILGSGPTGLILAQLLKLNGAAKIVIAANKGIKTDLARKLGVADDYIEIDRESQDQESQWASIKKNYPHGFDAVIEATGSEKIANQSIEYVRRGGTLMVYGVYANDARVHWPTMKIMANEIRIIGSFAQMYCFPRAIAYISSGKVKVNDMVTHSFSVKDYQQALDKLASRTAVKIIVKP
ncbi:NADP+-dependent D-mannitol dehydrogenase [Rhodocollybia butyracea]|uniref:NADP+-dependent D-mannitol dehydrogenase n=1 Tax=Rhodocollybia butyracea TaxID=206335 RepID=A0A9P5PUM6_9AGAR|nr:NADP+-dependent D-mannitol dehydrogenase [Rhodocollybia butyracea]